MVADGFDDREVVAGQFPVECPEGFSCLGNFDITVMGTDEEVAVLECQAGDTGRGRDSGARRKRRREFGADRSVTAERAGVELASHA